jgi:hypothetical protein
VQIVLRPNLDFRGFAGTVASGTLRRGDRVTALPSGRTTTVRSIVTFDGELAEASAPDAVTVTLADEIDLSRGDVLVHEGDAPHEGRSLTATVVWMAERPLLPGAAYWMKHATRLTSAEVGAIHHRLDVETFEPRPADHLGLNDIGRVSIAASRPLIFDRYRDNRVTGAFILVDRLTNATVGAGMIEGPGDDRSDAARGAGRVTTDERARRLGQRPLVVYLEGATEEDAFAVERRLFDAGLVAVVIDAARAGLVADLGLIAIVAGPEGGAADTRAGAHHLVCVRKDEHPVTDAALAALTSRAR